MQRQHGFAPTLILPTHLRSSVYLQAWVTYFLEDPNRDTYAHLAARHPHLGKRHVASDSLVISYTEKQRPRIGKLPAFHTVGLSIATLIQELVDLPNVIQKPALWPIIDGDVFSQQTQNMPELNINRNWICSQCAKGLFVARFWLWMMHKMESGGVPGYDARRPWCG